MVDKAISIAIIIILIIVMVSLGCTMELSKIKAHFLKPKGVVIAIVAQYGIMPLTAFSMAKAFQLRPKEVVAVLICGCCPGGNLSNIFALASQGDMNLSIVMTTCSTVLALGMMPLMLYLYCQGFSNLGDAIPYGRIIIALLMTLVFCAIGMYINHRVPQYSKTVAKVGMTIAVVTYVTIGILAGATAGDAIFKATSSKLLAISALMPLIGYTLGYVLSTLFKLNGSSKRTISMETGCQNLQLCITILKVAFRPEDIGMLYLFPVIQIMFQIIEALVFVFLFRCHQRFRKSSKGI
ncbi:sodium/bile acid cotransporter [Chanos chanos]|uniref:Hepatic sodium/bile acid cotransporter n=1 Tax=Chanos chanos TaxID=29144 RepID=A0A6J2V8A0_CHACN|nr:sodium/bile acid cotransporter-like [Chanos chanos]